MYFTAAAGEQTNTAAYFARASDRELHLHLRVLQARARYAELTEDSLITLAAAVYCYCLSKPLLGLPACLVSESHGLRYV
jgi:hypothetical protein